MKNLSEWGSFYWVVPIVSLAIFVTVAIEKKRYREKVLWIMLCIWAIGLLYLLFLYRLPGVQKNTSMDFYHMYREAALWNSSIDTNQPLRQIAFNMLLYVPYGVIVCSLSRRAWFTIFIGIGLSIVTEVVQSWTGLGWTDVDDVVSNTIGLLVGVLYNRIIRPIEPENGD